MGRPYGSGRAICESCISIDVRRWHREGRLHAGHCFTYSWTCNGEPFGDILVSFVLWDSVRAPIHRAVPSDKN
jgi:hypothetical protein